MKTVFITGSTRGIGKTLALEFAKKKYLVVLNGTRKTIHSAMLLKKLKILSPKSTIYYFDVSDTDQVEKNIQKIISKYKHIDILVNNAGIVRNKLFIKMDYKDFDEVIKINLYGIFNVTKALLPSMIANKWGRVINMTSISALMGDFGQTNYSASKAAVIGLTKSLAKETAKFNITVNAVSPGLVNTDILKDVPKEYMDKLIEKIPLKRMANVKEIANLILFLASNNSCYITGSIINIDGGLS